MISANKINELLGIKESYKAPETVINILFDKNKREVLFKLFLENESDLSYDFFQTYFENEHSDRKEKKQDFTPNAISEVISRIIGATGETLDVTSGTGGITIKKWIEDKKTVEESKYKPSMFFYHCEELSDRAIPFLLFNMMIRGMNVTILHGDVLTREVKQIYFVQNSNDKALEFSSLNVLPHSKIIAKEFNVFKWIEDEISYIEDRLETEE